MPKRQNIGGLTASGPATAHRMLWRTTGCCFWVKENARKADGIVYAREISSGTRGEERTRWGQSKRQGTRQHGLSRTWGGQGGKRDEVRWQIHGLNWPSLVTCSVGD
jgi:hypothetical protein